MEQHKSHEPEPVEEESSDSEISESGSPDRMNSPSKNPGAKLSEDQLILHNIKHLKDRFEAKIKEMHEVQAAEDSKAST